jgi:AcrR family transcriptional regulator
MTEATRQDIIDRAIVLFNKDMSLSLEKVAKKAGVTRRTLHRYFRDREELIKSSSDEMVLS